MFIISFKIPVCLLGSVFRNNCVILITSNFLFLHRFCLFAVVYCLFMFYVLFCFVFTWSWKLCWLNTFFFNVRLCVESWQTLKSLVHTNELFKVVLTRFVGAGWAHPWLQTEFCFFLVGSDCLLSTLNSSELHQELFIVVDQNSHIFLTCADSGSSSDCFSLVLVGPASVLREVLCNFQSSFSRCLLSSSAPLRIQISHTKIPAPFPSVLRFILPLPALSFRKFIQKIWGSFSEFPLVWRWDSFTVYSLVCRDCHHIIFKQFSSCLLSGKIPSHLSHHTRSKYNLTWS